MVGLGVGFCRIKSGFLGLAVLCLVRLGSPPARQLPENSGETLQLERLALPLATRCTGPIQSAEASIDGARVGLGTESVTGAHFGLFR